MSILRNKLKSNFSQLPNELITDSRLSHGAFRVAAYLFSRPDGWAIINADIQKQLGIKQAQTLADYWQELLQSGWVTRERKREGGRIVGGFDYGLALFMENPQYGKTLIKEDATIGEIHTPNNTDLENNTDSLNNIDFTNKEPNGVFDAENLKDYEKQASPPVIPIKEKRKRKKEILPIDISLFLKFDSPEKTFSAWMEWEQYKLKEKGQVYKTAESRAKAIKDLFELSKGKFEMVQKIIDKSIASLWAGLFELRPQTGQNTAPNPKIIDSSKYAKYGN